MLFWTYFDYFVFYAEDWSVKPSDGEMLWTVGLWSKQEAILY